jgi:hypothetical protein
MAKNILPERAIDAFWDGLIRRNFKEELGRCNPKTIDHLMSLANEWADGEDSIVAPRSRRRSVDRDVDAKDQFHSSSRKKGSRNRYNDADATDMVAAGYVNKDNRDGPRRGNNYYESSSRSGGRDSRPKMEWRRRRDQPSLSTEEMLDGGVHKTHLARQRWSAKTCSSPHRVQGISLPQSSTSGEDANGAAGGRCHSLQRSTTTT